MKKIFLLHSAVCLVAIALLLAPSDSSASASLDKVVMDRSITAVSPEKVSGAPTAAEFASTRQIMVPLKLRNFGDLQARISRGETVSRSEMGAKYYPVAADYETVRAWLESEGFKISRTDSNRLAIFATATLAQIRQHLETEFRRVRTADGEFVSAVSAPSVPAYVAPLIHGINGLQPHIRMHKHSRSIAPILQRESAATPQSQQVPNAPPFLVGEIAKAYGANSLTQTGAGETIAIVIDTFPLTTDLTAFWAINASPQTISNVTFVPVVDNILNYPAPTGEETLDTEWSSGIASGSKIRVYGSFDLATIDIDACFLQVLADVPTEPSMHELSLSFGIGEVEQDSIDPAEIDNEDSLFAAMAASGITVFASSGDTGSKINATTQVSYPASDPNVTAVGGTSLLLRSCTGDVTSETTWNGSGGGISAHFARPAWQSGLNSVSNVQKRLVPDVSSIADPNTGALVILNGIQAQFGGTSLSAPIWAGFNALINQARAAGAQPSVGLLAPKIYPYLGTTAFRDITGSNSNGGYFPLSGYDLVTGVGSPNVAVLLSALASGTTPPPNPTPAPTPVPTPAPVYGLITAPDTTCPLTGSAMTFSWATSPGTATAYILTAGKTRGSTEFFNSGQTGAKFVNARNLPTDGRDVWIRLWSLVGGHWYNPPQDYKYTAQALRVQAPVLGPNPGSYRTRVVVNMASPTPGATLRFTINGTTPTSFSQQFIAPFTLLKTTTVRVIAQKPGVPDSVVTVGTYIIR